MSVTQDSTGWNPVLEEGSSVVSLIMREGQYLGQEGGYNGPEAPKHRGGSHQLGERKLS